MTNAETTPFAVFLALVIVIGTAVGVAQSCGRATVGICTDYTFKVSRLGRNKQAICDRHPGMKIRVEKRLPGEAFVHCTCAASELNHE
jgi:hypothetical protein